jgi:acetylornithine deacetylase
MDITSQTIEAVERHRQEALALIQEMVRTPSLEGEEKKCQEIMARKMEDIGLDVDMWAPDDEELRAHQAYVPTGFSYKERPNVVGIYRGKGGGRSLILNGHVDVVPTGRLELWTRSPWSGHFEDGKVYGRGSSDMKGGVVSNVIVAQALTTAGIRLKGDLFVESVVDEEGGGNGTLGCILRGYTADACNISEPSGTGAIGVANRGAQYFRLLVPGEAGGTEHKHQLVNPITKSFEVFHAIEAYSIMRESSVSHPLYDPFYTTKVPLGVCKLQVGEWPSTVGDMAVMEGTIECLPGEDIQDVKAKFKAYLMEWAAKDPWLKDHPLQLEWFGLWFEAAETPIHHPYIEALSSIIQDVTGSRPVIGGASGCDLRLPVLYGNTPTAIFGPKGGWSHGTDEYVEFEQIITCAKILALAAVKWCEIE